MRPYKCEQTCSYQKDGFCRLDPSQRIFNGEWGECIHKEYNTSSIKEGGNEKGIGSSSSQQYFNK